MKYLTYDNDWMISSATIFLKIPMCIIITAITIPCLTDKNKHIEQTICPSLHRLVSHSFTFHMSI